MEGDVHPDFGQVTETLRKITTGRHGTGAAVAVYHRGELVVDAWTGVRDADGTPWERDTISMSFSTTKGVVATVVHRLVDRGLLAYDAPVAEVWPEFAAGGKGAITLRHLLTHTAGLHDVRHLVDDARTLLDWDEMVGRLAAATPAWEPGTRPGYHGLTYGWLVGELIRRVTGGTVDEAVRTELVEPLGLDGAFVGAPAEERHRLARLLVHPDRAHTSVRRFERMERYDWSRPFVDALIVDGLIDVVDSGAVYDAELPAANGTFTARSLARLYAALATPDAFDEPPLVSEATLAEATRVQVTGRDAVVQFPMRWRLGYHLAATTRGAPPAGFGHFGFGGSGAWGDPESGLAIGFVLNDVAGTPFADTRLLRLGAAALRSARRR